MVISTDEKRHLERLVDSVIEARAMLDLVALELSQRLDVSVDVAVDAINEADEVQDLLDKFGIEVSSCVRTRWENVQRSCTGDEPDPADYFDEDDEEMFGPWGDTYGGW